MKSKMRDTHFIYEYFRKVLLFGFNIRPIIKAMDAQPGDRILDAGCGFGFLSKYFADCNYTGIDLATDRIDWAIENFGENSNKKFIASDICRIPFENKSFDKVVCYGLLHHLSDEAAKVCLTELVRITEKRIVFADPVYSKWHLISNFLCALDRGDHVRNKDEYLQVCVPYFKNMELKYFYSNNGIAQYLLISAEV